MRILALSLALLTLGVGGFILACSGTSCFKDPDRTEEHLRESLATASYASPESGSNSTLNTARAQITQSSTITDTGIPIGEFRAQVEYFRGYDDDVVSQFAQQSSAANYVLAERFYGVRDYSDFLADRSLARALALDPQLSDEITSLMRSSKIASDNVYENSYREIAVEQLRAHLGLKNRLQEIRDELPRQLPHGKFFAPEDFVSGTRKGDSLFEIVQNQRKELGLEPLEEQGERT